MSYHSVSHVYYADTGLRGADTCINALLECINDVSRALRDMHDDRFINRVSSCIMCALSVWAAISSDTCISTVSRMYHLQRTRLPMIHVLTMYHLCISESGFNQ